MIFFVIFFWLINHKDDDFLREFSNLVRETTVVTLCVTTVSHQEREKNCTSLFFSATTTTVDNIVSKWLFYEVTKNFFRVNIKGKTFGKISPEIMNVLLLLSGIISDFSSKL